jgi:hypothetical protein
MLPLLPHAQGDGVEPNWLLRCPYRSPGPGQVLVVLIKTPKAKAVLIFSFQFYRAPGSAIYIYRQHLSPEHYYTKPPSSNTASMQQQHSVINGDGTNGRPGQMDTLGLRTFLIFGATADVGKTVIATALCNEVTKLVQLPTQYLKPNSVEPVFGADSTCEFDPAPGGVECAVLCRSGLTSVFLVAR